MSPGLESGSDDRIHAGLLKCCCLMGCGRRANRDDVFRPALLQDFLWWDPVDEAEHGYLLVQQDASLILKSYPRIGFVLWTRRPQGCDMGSKWRKAFVERVFIRSSSTIVTPSGRLATPYTNRPGFLSFPKTSCSSSEAPSAIFGCSRTSPEVATNTPSRTIRVTLSSDPKCWRATARALSAAR